MSSAPGGRVSIAAGGAAAAASNFVSVKPIEVSPALEHGEKFIKWDEVRILHLTNIIILSSVVLLSIQNLRLYAQRNRKHRALIVLTSPPNKLNLLYYRDIVRS